MHRSREMCIVNVKLIPIIQIRRNKRRHKTRRHGVQKAARILHAFTSLRHSWSDSCVRDTIKRRKRIREKDWERKRESMEKNEKQKEGEDRVTEIGPRLPCPLGPRIWKVRNVFIQRYLLLSLSFSFPSVNDRFMLISLSAAWKKKKSSPLKMRVYVSHKNVISMTFTSVPEERGSRELDT